ncbi:mobile element transfer protein [Streptomyces rimosus]|uniref:mobile element transfer protein n=1 Tax=Streptomyces rimosus TaxID=1927 RepID=UPI000518F8C0|nr:mobile element transfer protein [Streptomyces rimosus]
MPRYRFWNRTRTGQVEVATHLTRNGTEAHVAVCTAPGCNWSSGEHTTRAAAELAADTHRCNPR